MPDRPTCSTCIYFKQQMGVFGECRIGPDFVPRAVTDWCGEHPDFPRPAEAVPVPVPEPTPGAPADPQPVQPAQRRRKPTEDN